MEYRITLFLKFGEEKYVRDLYENGTVYLNPIEYFRKKEDQELRDDKYEGVSRIINSLPGSFLIPSINHTVHYRTIHLKQAYRTVAGNLYSLYCVSSFGFPYPLDFKIDERMARFGTHCLMIKDNGRFLNLVEQNLKKQNLVFHNGFVNYYDKNKINREVNLFEKPLDFEYQKEFRFYVERDIIKPIKIIIGNMKDYSEILTMEEVLQMRLELKAAI